MLTVRRCGFRAKLVCARAIEVGDAGGVEAILQRRAVEVGQPARRARPHVRDRTDIGRFQQSLESQPVMLRVPNAENERRLV